MFRAQPALCLRLWTGDGAFTAAQDLIAVFHVGKQRLCLPGSGPGRCLLNARERARKSAVYARTPMRGASYRLFWIWEQ